MAVSDITSYKCPCCGAELKFSSKSQKMSCEYCGTALDVAAVKQFSEAAVESHEDNFDWESYSEQTISNEAGVRTYICKSCGAEITGDETLGSSECPYCASPIVMNEQFSGMLRPDLVIPFKVDKAQAQTEFKRFCGKKKLIPSDFISTHRIENIKGVYVPYWLFDCETEANIRYRAEKVRCWTEGDYDVTETSHFLLLRDGKIGFEHVPVDATTKLEACYTEAIEPYDMADAVPYNSAYLSGFLSDRYDISAEESKSRANERIRNTVEEEFRKTTTDYLRVTAENTSIRFNDGKINYSLMPMWLLTAKYKDKVYTFAMNGQTGRFVGRLPISVGKAMAWFFGIAISVGIISAAALLTSGVF